MKYKYWYVSKNTDGTEVFLRAETEKDANEAFEFFKRVHPTPGNNPPVRMNRIIGWLIFRTFDYHQQIVCVQKHSFSLMDLALESCRQKEQQGK